MEKIDAKTAIKEANRFVLENMRDRFSAGTPKKVLFPTRDVWVVAVVLTYPKKGIVGEVGAIAVDGETGEIVGWTSVEEMEEMAKEIYEGRRKELEIAFSYI